MKSIVLLMSMIVLFSSMGHAECKQACPYVTPSPTPTPTVTPTPDNGGSDEDDVDTAVAFNFSK